MRKIHKYLSKKSSAYSKWHDHSAHSYVHMAVFIAISIVFSVAIYANASATIADSIPAVTVVAPQTVAGTTGQLLKLAKKYEAATEEEQALIIQDLTNVINSRKSLLKNEIKNNPKKFLFDRLPQEVIDKMPESVQALLEQTVDVEGTITATHADDFKGNKEKIFYQLKTTDGTKYNLQLTEDNSKITTGSKVKVHGISLDQDIAAAPSSGSTSSTTGTSVQITSTTSAGAPLGPVKDLVILINFTNDTSQPWSNAGIAANMFTNSDSVNAYYQQNSFGTMSVAGDVVGWYTIPYTNQSCDSMYSSWEDAADQAATKAGINLANYAKRTYLTNDVGNAGGCTWGGWGDINGPRAIMFGYADSKAIAHEFGHNIGFNHAQSLTCGSKQIDVYANCSTDVYGDRSDVMGNPWRSYGLSNGPHKAGMGFTPATQVQNVTSSGTYTIGALESSDTSIKTLKISKADTYEAYYISYRQPIGFDAALDQGLTGGVSIAVGPVTSPVGFTSLLDLTPGDGSMYNAALTDGGVFQDPSNGITITQVSRSGSTVTVNVQMSGPVCTQSNPSVSVSPTPQSGASGQALKYNVSVSNYDNSACAGSTFSLGSTVPTGWSAAFSSPTISVAPGATVNSTLTVTPPTSTPDGTYGFSVTGQDTTARSASASATYVSYTDSVPPQVYISSPSNGATVSTKKPTSIKVSATDSSGIKSITISVDSKVIATCTTSSCSASPKLSAGSHTITVTAIDKSASQLSSSATISVTAK